MAQSWRMLYENALHSDSSELLAAIRNAANVMHTRLQELVKPRGADDVREKSAIYRALSDLHVLSSCFRPL